MAAIASSSDALCTTDQDFWDPANKAKDKPKKKGVKVLRHIERTLPIHIYLPSELVAAYIP